jgi:ferritin
LIYSNTLDGLALTHSYSYQEYASFIQYSQQEMENMGAKKIINYVADTGEITLFSNLDDMPDLFSLY